MSKPTRIIIIEDHEVVRLMYREFLELYADFAVAGEAESAEESIPLLRCTDATVALVDVALPGMSGVELVRQMHHECACIAFLMVSAHREPKYAQDAAEAGARGYVVKGDPDRLVDAIRRVSEGGTYFDGAHA